jgi:uncharacterized surface protein with fasciclin (FAS1) repeats
MKTLKLNALALIAFLAIGISSCSKDDSTPTPTPPADTTITGLAVATPNLSILVKALTRAGLADDLQGTGQFTAFAPTNDAFNAFFASLGPNVTVDNVDLPTLTKILLNHVIPSEIKSAAIPASTYVSTLSPFSTAAGAPTISMFVQKEGANVYINGGTATIGVKVTTADVDASNGVIHIVNKVIAIPTIVDHAKANPLFSTLVTVVTSTATNGNGFGDQSAVATALTTNTTPLTVFAPINAAFTAATTGTGFAVGASPATVSKVLQYHVVGGNNRAASLQNNTDIPTILNEIGSTTLFQKLKVLTDAPLGARLQDKATAPNNISKIIATDVQCSNGVVHAIDKVLQPTL